MIKHKDIMPKAGPSYQRELQLLQTGYRFICGVDEVGRGPLAGPVVAAAVILDPERFCSKKMPYLLDGLNDSKALKKEKREELYKQIFDVSLSVGLGSIPAKIIDSVNIRQATFLAMTQAIKALALAPDYVLIDGRDKVPHLAIEQEPIIKGDQNIFSIAAASIIAKVTRDNMMQIIDQIHPHYGFAKHMGYPTKKHKEALIEKGPIDSLHRFSFNSVRL